MCKKPKKVHEWSQHTEGGLSSRMETCGNKQLGREHMRNGASQTRRQINQQSKVMVKPSTHISKIHTYIYKKSLYNMRKKTTTYIIRVTKITEIQQQHMHEMCSLCHINK